MKRNNLTNSIISSLFSGISLFSYTKVIVAEIKIGAQHFINDICKLAFIGMLIQTFLLVSILSANLILFVLLLDLYYGLFTALAYISCLNLFFALLFIYVIGLKKTKLLNQRNS